MADRNVLIAPSLLSSDFSRLAEEVTRCETADADWLHWDVMDGHFVPNLTFGAEAVKACRPVTTLPFDVHLMIDRPDIYLDSFLDAGADIVTVHVESPCDVAGTLARIRSAGKRAGISLRPGTLLDVLAPYVADVDLILIMSVEPGFGGQSFLPAARDRVKAVADERARRGLSYQIEIDGGIDTETAPGVIAAGVDILVSGSHLFRQSDLAAAIAKLRAVA